MNEQQNDQYTTHPHEEAAAGQPAEDHTVPVEGAVEKKSSSGVLTLVAVVLGCAVIAAGAWYFMNLAEDGTSPLTGGSTEEVAMQQSDYPDVVATVNGEDLSKEEFEMSYAQIEQNANAQGADISAAEVQAQIEAQAIEVLVNTKVLLQAAAEAGVSVTDDMVAEEMMTLEAQYESPEAFATAIEENSLTMEQIETDIRERLIIDEYLAEAVDSEAAAVTEAEISEFYDSAATQGGELPPLSEVSAQIEQQLLSQKQQEAISEFVSSLRSAAEVDIKI